MLERRGRRGHVDQGPPAPPRGGWDVRSDAPPRRHDRVPAVRRRPRRARSHGPDQGVSGRALVGALACCAALAVPGVSHAARYHVGLAPGAEPRVVAAAVERATGVRPDEPRAVAGADHRCGPGGRFGASPASRGSSRRASGGSPSRRRIRWPTASGTRREPLVRRLGDAAASRAGARRGDRLGRRSRSSRPPAAHRRREELRRRDAAGHARSRHDRGRDHRRRARQRDRHRRPGARGGADGRKGRLAGRDDRGRGRGEGDPLGGGQRRAGGQHLARRPSRPAQPGPRHVLAARGGGDPATRYAAARSSWQRSETPIRRRTRRGGSRATRPRSHT